MQTLLFVNACIRKEASRTYEIAKTYLDERKENSDIVVLERDLTSANIPFLTEKDFCSGEQKPHSEEVKALAQEFANADEILIAAPFWEFAFPAVLSCYIECVSLVGTAFRYSDTGSIGMCKAKLMTHVYSSGDILKDGDNIGANLLEKLSKLYGIEEFQSFGAEGLDLPFINVKEVMEQTCALAKEKGNR